jgi:RNA polymerase sigma factor (sigma-70 family)
MVESVAVTATDLHRTVETVWRMESPKIVAALARMVRDVGVAEELAQDAVVSALEQWPVEGVPRNPGAWLMGAAKHRAIDRLRRRRMLDRKHEQLAYEIDSWHSEATQGIEASLDDDVGDDLLRLVFTACHPVLSTEAQVALTLRLLCGLTTEEIARAFLVPDATMAQRIVRAKRTLTKANVPFEVPRGPEREERLASVLAVIYLVFNEGYSATAGDDWIRPALCDEALRLVRVVAGLAPDEAEVHGLAALLELQASRLKARVDLAGRAVLLNQQDRTRWDRLLIARGLEALRRARRLTSEPGPYTIQAGIAACHAAALTPADTDWPAIVALYDRLLGVLPSPIVELNRAVAVSMAFGPQAGLDLVEELGRIPALADYHLLPAVQGDLLERVGRLDEAQACFQRAAALAQNGAERELLRERIARSEGRGLAR